MGVGPFFLEAPRGAGRRARAWRCPWCPRMFGCPGAASAWVLDALILGRRCTPKPTALRHDPRARCPLGCRGAAREVSFGGLDASLLRNRIGVPLVV